MYDGDEVSAIVVDLGSHTCKAGYAGEDAPKAVFPSVIGSIDQMEVDEPDNPDKNSGSVPDSKSKAKRKLYVGSQALGFRRDHVEVLSPIKDGIVADWEIVESIWDHAFKECLLIDPKEHPMLLAEPCANSQQQREKSLKPCTTIPGMENFAETAPSVRGLPQMVLESINKCDVDIRRELFSSILLAGGTASMQQLKERLEKDLLEESPQAARVKVLASGNATERRFMLNIVNCYINRHLFGRRLNRKAIRLQH
ncbi:actin-related protein 4 [Coffea eugenioides]|uniref:actin-related protein 4 n=1 Tax=Coffea eugenioides TaxID=49369 RepID=UPI000F608A96|nr:actin-related protein 4 [Coffea eugenioides]